MNFIIKLLKKAGRAYFRATEKNAWITCPTGMIPYNYTRS